MPDPAMPKAFVPGSATACSMLRHRFLLQFGLVLLAACILACLGSARAQSIVNTADIAYRSQGQVRHVRSNTVTLEVPPLRSQLAVLPATTAATSPVELPGGICGGHALAAVSVDQSVVQAATPATIRQLKLGQTIVFRLQLSPALLQAGKVDTLEVTLTSASGDVENVAITETGPDTATFFGALPTSAIPPQPVAGDCRLSLADGDMITITYKDRIVSALVAQAQVEVLSDPFGLVFDSEDGAPVSGATVTLVDAQTGAPATVRADDGRTSWPSSVVTGQDVIDGAGNVWPMPAGEYRFPLVPLGHYRLVVTPPAGYSAPSKVSSASLAALRRPDGAELEILPASFGNPLELASLAPVRVDIPLDRPARAVAVTKSASRDVAQPGDTIFFRVRVRNADQARGKTGLRLFDRTSPQLRLLSDSVRVGGALPAAGAFLPDSDGRGFALTLGSLGPGEERLVTYAMTVRPDAAAGFASNRAQVADSRDLSGFAVARVRIERDALAATMTLIGRVTLGGCDASSKRQGLPGVRIALEDGSFAVSDASGRFHFEGLGPGTHVAELQAGTLPEGARVVDCARSTRSAGSALSRFVTGQGGSLARVDYAVVLAPGSDNAMLVSSSASGEAPEDGRMAAGADIDWLALGDGPTEFLFPQADHNPRAPAVRVVIRHRAGERVDLRIDGEAVDKLAFDGARTSPDGYAVSIWRGIPLRGEQTLIEADVRRPDQSLAASLTRTVNFTATPARAELAPGISRLVADGRTRPVIAVRVLDRNGRPVHAGLAGTLAISAPYESAAAIDARQGQLMAGSDQPTPTWSIKGDDGVALVELAPTMVSGRVELAFEFIDREIRRRQIIEAWLLPGEQKWTLVGVAEAAIGARSIADHMERADRFDSNLGRHARTALYAKGRIKGRYLMTIAYDSAKQAAEQRLLGGLDPKAYYTVFGDGSDRRFDAASTGKLYVRIESGAFRALVGDFVTGFDHTVLGRYQRVLTGTAVDVRSGNARIEGFAAQSANAHRRDEMPGAGLSGPYRLSSRRIVPNSESVTLEVRDRFRSELVLSSRKLVRFVDYEVDILAGTIQFKEPILSRDDNLNPRTIVVEYDVDTAAPGEWTGGLRGELLVADSKLRLGATAISQAGQSTDAGSAARTTLAGLDARLALDGTLEVRAETALSSGTGPSQFAYLLEIERHDSRSDVLAYIRSIDGQFGLGQASIPELGRRKLGLDGRLALGSNLSVSASLARDVTLGEPARRDLMQLRGTWQAPGLELRLGLARYADTLGQEQIGQEQMGQEQSSAVTLIEAGATRRLLDNRLELTATGAIALGDGGSSSWQPPRYRAGARYSVTSSVRLVADYEMSRSDDSETRTLRAGFEVAPWSGARVTSVLGREQVTEQGKRVFAAYGLAQSVPVGKRLTLDASIDGSRKVGGDAQVTVARTGIAGTATATSRVEDFTAYTLGANWRSGRWSVSSRAELREGSAMARKGLALGAVRQLGEGSIVGFNMTLTDAKARSAKQAEDDRRTHTRSVNAALSLAHRPDASRFALLAKAELRSDMLRGEEASGEWDGVGIGSATAVTANAASGTVDARSTRLLGAVSANFTPQGRDGEALVQRQEFVLFLAARYGFDRYEGYGLQGTSLVAGADVRIGLGERFEVGAVGTVRRSLRDGTSAFALGPQIGIAPARNAMIVIGYNATGFRDRDFAENRNTRKGLFASVKLKFESAMLAGLGGGR